MPTTVRARGEVFTFPEGTSDDEIGVALDEFFSGEPSDPDLERGTGESLLIGVGSGLTRAGQGAKQAALALGESVGVVPEGRTEEFTQEAQAEREFFRGTPVGESTPGQIGELVGETLPFLIPGGATVRGAAAAGAGVGALAFQEDPEDVGFSRSRATSTALGAGFGGIAQALPALAGAAGRKIREAAHGFRPRVSALEGVTEAATREATEAAERLSTFVTPAEASGDPVNLIREAKLAFTTKTQRSVLETLRKREAVLQKELGRIYTGLVPEGVDAARTTATELQNQAFSRPIGGALRFLTDQDKGIRKAAKDAAGVSFKALARSAREQGLEINPGTVGELHLVRQSLDDIIQAAKSKGEPIRGLMESRKLLLEMADAISPEYAVARSVNQRLIIRDNVLEELRKAKIEDVEGSMNFFNKFLAKGDKRKQFMDDLSFITEEGIRDSTIAKVEALEPLLRAVNKSPLAKVSGFREPALQARGVGGPRGVVANLIATAAGGTYDRAIVEFITDPNWTAEMMKQAVRAKGSRLGNFAEFLELVNNRTVAVAAANEQGEQ